MREFTGFWAPQGCRKFYTSFYVKMAPRRRETRVIQSFLLLGYGWRVKPYPKNKIYDLLWGTQGTLPDAPWRSRDAPGTLPDVPGTLPGRTWELPGCIWPLKRSKMLAFYLFFIASPNAPLSRISCFRCLKRERCAYFVSPKGRIMPDRAG